ncbi:sce7726 family protein [Pseudobutyrivibrio sp.]|uniref:sce7726 family protein n=1 Tax=Pseudobutyrivibrio sp. TaxID=2014367 RepID=UPI001B428B8E|nr:sce7726 family protein [Pseudobutyrivibrio sp.]MBP3261953.1 sce7726 family protein [Pseudobutyrivibrio sp.]
MLKDKDIREPLFDFLECEYGKTRIIEEKMMGNSRADVIMVITGALVGIEIKSDADTYVRLESQIKDYDKYFDYNIVVVGTSHANHVGEHIPEHWGIITVDAVDEKADFYFLRRPVLNKKMKLNRKLELLWRPELALLQERYKMPKYPGKSKSFIRKTIMEWTKLPLTQAEITRIKRAAKLEGCEPFIPETRIDKEDLNAQVSELLFERDYEKLLAEIAEYRKAHNPRRRGTKKSTSVRRVRRLAKSNK